MKAEQDLAQLGDGVKGLMADRNEEKGEKGHNGPLAAGQQGLFYDFPVPTKPERARAEGAPGLAGLTLRPGLLRRLLFRGEAILERLAEDWRRDGEEQNARFLWLVCALALGAASYFSLPDEPNLLVLGCLVLALSLVVINRARRGRSVFLILIAVMGMLGCLSAGLQSQLFTTPVLAKEQSAEIVGQLERVERRVSGDERWTVRVESIKRLKAEETPAKLLLVRKAQGEDFHAGDRLRMFARIAPLQRSAYPGGFDYGRFLWSRSIGAQGYLSKRIERLPARQDDGLSSIAQGLSVQVEGMRAAIADYIAERMEGDAAGLAVALSVGKRDRLAEQVETDLRRSGLAHILAISGLHMGLVAMSVFWGVRMLLSLLPPLALGHPIKEWSAGIALICATFYLVLSGASFATIRAFVMIAIFLVAIMAGRSALTMHNLALAMLLLLFLQPYGVIEAGMQMSFAATAALIATYDRFTVRRREALAKDGEVKRGGANHLNGVPGGIVLLSYGSFKWIAGIGLTSLIASLAVLPFSIAHFQQVAPLGLIANLMVMPIISLVVMPLGLLSFVFYPFGLQSLPLIGAQWGLEQVIWFAHIVSSHSDPNMVIVKQGGSFLLVATFALMIFAIHRRTLALTALVPAVVAVLLWWGGDGGDLWVSESGRRIAVRGDDQRWQLIGSNRMVLDFSALLRAEGDVRAVSQEDVVGRDQLRTVRGGAGLATCDQDACVIRSLLTSSGEVTGLSVALIKNPSAFAEECSKRSVIVSNLPAPQTCTGPKLVMDRDVLAKRGSQTMTFIADKSSEGQSPVHDPPTMSTSSQSMIDWQLSIQTAMPKGKRPWHRGS
ncbi:ComEC/Rec2 family competence protein [uncultured Cohaesibacter sp.]|uniref:ComEC/Rec2 family competence protein n=1 Tax=uncultured Cohaesibacter sp. TaxID=1002546 RepID=UPI0029C8E088|nr:ComEC/Rec2 family competence protein [uncultured Cohaesibacter sp.]